MKYNKEQKVAIFSLFSIGYEFAGQQGAISVAACLYALGFESAGLAEIYHDLLLIIKYRDCQLEEKINEIVDDLGDGSEKFFSG